MLLGEGKVNYKYFDFAKRISEKEHNAIEHDFINLVYTLKAFDENDTSKALDLLSKVGQEKILSSAFQNQDDPFGYVNKFLVKKIAVQLSLLGKKTLAMKYIFSFSSPVNRRNTLVDVAEQLQKSGHEGEMYPYLDTLFSEIDKENKFSLRLLNILGKVGSQDIFDIAENLIKDIDDKIKPRAMNNCYGHC
jgi:hypothetical protein